MQLSWLARGAATAHRMRFLMELRGFTPNGHRLWDAAERGHLHGGYPDYEHVAVLVTERTLTAIRSKASRDKITKPRGRPWDDPNEIWRLKLYRTGTKAEILAAFPGRSWKAIAAQAIKRGHRRQKAPVAPSGIVIIDQIHARATAWKMTLTDLDQVGGAKGYFTKRRWRRRQNHAVHERVVLALGGRLRARFNAAGG